MTETYKRQGEQKSIGFMDCQGRIYVFSEHLKPNGKKCKPNRLQLTTGILFIQDPLDERNQPGGDLYGKCQACGSKIIIPINKLQSNG